MDRQTLEMSSYVGDSETEVSMSSNKATYQISTSLPNFNSKRIDYVIVYQYDANNMDKVEKERNDIREMFFERLKEESLQVYFITFKKNNVTVVYALLHCPIPRLMLEAEKLKLQMRLNNNFIVNDELEDAPTLAFLDNFFKFLGIKRDLKVDTSGIILSAEFERSIYYLFEAFDETKNKEPFDNRIRSLLVDNILKNFQLKENSSSFSHESNGKYGIVEEFKRHKFAENYKKFAGLNYMMNENYFSDAFILHNRTSHLMTIGHMIQSVGKDDLESFENYHELLNTIAESNKYQLDFDIRKELHFKWARLTNFFKFQPINLIRSYFGEAFALYFAWIGHFIFCLFLPTLIGIIFFFVGLSWSVREGECISNKNTTQKDNSTQSRTSVSAIQDTFACAFNNDLTPYFALIISLWGAFFTETWLRENARLAFEWDVLDFEKEEPDLPEYTRKNKELKKKLKNQSNFVKYIYSFNQTFKRALSYFILLIMIGAVAMEVAAIVVYRVYIFVEAYPDNAVLKTILGDVGSSIMNAIFINIMNNIYGYIAVRLTNWENYRTQTEYEDNLIFKLFAFQFVNSYASLFYIAFFRNINYSNGIFNWGPQYVDKCDNDNCMALLSIQVLTVLLIKPLPTFFYTVIWPLAVLLIKRIRAGINDKKIMPINENNLELGHKNKSKINQLKQNESIVSINIAMERNKSNSDKTIQTEFTEKVILYGYIMLFACSFSLGPLIVLLILAFDMRVDGLRLLWLYRRPVGYQAQDIGAWLHLLQFLNVIGIISNSFIIAFTSSWSKTVLQDKLEFKLLFVVAFEHFIFFMWLLIQIILPDVPKSVTASIRNESKLVKSIFSAARTFKKPNNGGENIDYERKSHIEEKQNNPLITESDSQYRRRKRKAMRNMRREMSELKEKSNYFRHYDEEDDATLTKPNDLIRRTVSNVNYERRNSAESFKSNKLPPLTMNANPLNKRKSEKHLKVREKILSLDNEEFFDQDEFF